MNQTCCLAILVFVAQAAAQTVNNAPGQTTNVSDCRAISPSTADEMAAGLDYLDMGRVDSAITIATRACGVSEVSLRISILSAIFKDGAADDKIRTYLENGYPKVIRRRIVSSRQLDYEYLYSDDSIGYSYVPLRHRVDSVAGHLAQKILSTKTLTQDERLMCMLFAGDVDGFESGSSRKRVDDKSVIGTYRTNQVSENARNGLGMVLYTGLYAPVGAAKVIGNSALLGLGLSSPIANKFTIELAVKFRFHGNEGPFLYHAMGVTNVVNSDFGVFFGAIGGYNLFDNEKVVVHAKFGLGLESLDTGLWEPSVHSTNPNNSTETVFNDVTTVHLSPGLAVMKRISLRHHIGLALNYHFCPYTLDNNLLTGLDSSALSAELFLRF